MIRRDHDRYPRARAVARESRRSARFGSRLRELAADDILLADVIAGINAAITVEEYPMFAKGPCVLALQRNDENRPLHVVWGIPKDHASPAVLVTAYRPNPEQWSSDFRTRR